MSYYRKHFAIVELNEKGVLTARQAWKLACSLHAELAISVVVDYTPGWEGGYAPFLTPRQMKSEIMKDIAKRLDAMLEDIGITGVEQIIIEGPVPRSILEIAGSWGADLLVVGSNASYGLNQGASGISALRMHGFSMDLLTLNTANVETGWRGRLVHALSGVF
ncbi:MAG: universal stress protein [Magnetococcales bacterium]|nr:universal stress protein [Magnetococcales bacterium]MBF0420343.1 universal stress protein [Magnetococcales bacterium]